MKDEDRQALKQMNVTFASFKQIGAALLTKGAKIDENSWVDFFHDYSDGVHVYMMPAEEWFEMHFQDFSLEIHDYELRSKSNQWTKITPEGSRPPFNVSVILCLPKDDDPEPRYIEGMWDISEKWTDIRTYETPNPLPTHYRLIYPPEK